MRFLRRFFRWVFPQGEFWNRLVIGTVLLIGSFAFVGCGAIIVISIALSNTVRNDTQFEAFCRQSVGLPKRLVIRPGKEDTWIDTYSCGIYDRGREYVGCLEHDHQDEPVLVSSFDSDIADSDCDITWRGR